MLQEIRKICALFSILIVAVIPAMILTILNAPGVAIFLTTIFTPILAATIFVKMNLFACTWPFLHNTYHVGGPKYGVGFQERCRNCGRTWEMLEESSDGGDFPHRFARYKELSI